MCSDLYLTEANAGARARTLTPTLAGSLPDCGRPYWQVGNLSDATRVWKVSAFLGLVFGMY
jgi:hypothetical protein